jgi:DNA-binding LacI/PurR family transcriptional regulator
MSRRTTIEDVARHAGVGKVTVSYVLNGRSRANRISEATEAKVLAAAEELKYRPNALARGLATRRTDTIAVVFQSGTYFTTWSGFTSEVMRGVALATVEGNYDLMLHTKQVTGADEEAIALTDGRVDGVLILRDENDPTLLRLIESGFPCVQFFTRNEGLEVPWVDCDNVEGGRIATQHLLDLGHKRIAMVHGSKRSNSSNDRRIGYRNCLTANGIEPRDAWSIERTDLSADPGPVVELFTGRDRPTALFVWSDDIALTILHALRAKKISVPDDVSIVGFDSSVAAINAVPALTSVCQPVQAMAAAATRMLIKLIRGEKIPTQDILFQPILDVRESTGRSSDSVHSTQGLEA